MIKPGGYFEYVIDDKTYYVKNTGIVVYLADFGSAEVLSPLFTNKYYGLRNAKVMKSKVMVNGSYLYWKPIIMDKRDLFWRTDKEGELIDGTRNDIYSTKTPFNLKDTMTFPPFEFSEDIRGVIRMFLCDPVAKKLDHKLKDLLYPHLIHLIYEKKIYNIYGTVKYVLANKMLDHLYVEPTVDYVVDRFVIGC
jgi:hypothetical protein